jgi:hypothetical protein
MTCKHLRNLELFTRPDTVLSTLQQDLQHTNGGKTGDVDASNLKRLPFTSNVAHYLKQDQNFERVAQGIETEPRNIEPWLKHLDSRYGGA